MRIIQKDRPYAEGPGNASVMLIGQNPGKMEAETGRPFAGRAGKYLNRVLEQNQLDRKRLYITPVVKALTPNNRKPNAEEIRKWLPVLVEEIKETEPEIILLMGEVAWKTPRMGGIIYMETYHPAAAMRFPRIREKFENDMKKLKEMILDMGIQELIAR